MWRGGGSVESQREYREGEGGIEPKGGRFLKQVAKNLKVKKSSTHNHFLFSLPLRQNYAGSSVHGIGCLIQKSFNSACIVQEPILLCSVL